MEENPSATQMQEQNPHSQNPTQIDNLYANPHYPHFSTFSSSVYYPHSQNPNPFYDPNYSTATGPVNTPTGYEYKAHQPGLPPAVPAAYYQDPNAATNPYGLAPYASAAGVTIPSTGVQKLVTSNHGSKKSSAWRKGPKKIKVVQSAWCEICRVDCNSKNILDQHKLGKKHKKNLEKLVVANTSVLAPATVSASVPPATSTVPVNPVIGPQENPDKANSAISQKARKKAADAEDLETKKKKILEGGAAVDAVRICAICNVVCNSETVFRYHLAGQKHAAMMKKHTSATGVASAT
ncbi:hypothetical protein ACH5RR_014244 [Cinchona calisaya]|uniref:U1-type domain-containing protein n=1 Tax=Cinchona calisaya TaxID=153742 RepID=A0ABD3A5Z3_9GENT